MPEKFEPKENLDPETSPEKQYPVKRVCARCQREMGDAGFTSNEEGEISHGLCSKCEAEQMEEIKRIEEQMGGSGEQKEKKE